MKHQIKNSPLSYKYLLYTPGSPEEDSTTDVAPKRKYPLLLFLHGSSEKGDDIKRVLNHGVPKYIEDHENFPFMTVSPQCTGFDYWRADKLKCLLDQVIGEHMDSIDINRIYCTGCNMGGFATWKLAISYPCLFAAIAPVCGGGDWQALNRSVNEIVDVSVWSFHGENDRVVYSGESKRMVDALANSGGNAKLTVYPNCGHDCWSVTYNNKELYQWLSTCHKVDVQESHE